MAMSDARKIELMDLIAKNQFQINLVVEESSAETADGAALPGLGFLSVIPAMDGEESEEFDFPVAEGQEEAYLKALDAAVRNWDKEHAQGTIFWQRKKTSARADAEKISLIDFLATNQLSVCISLDGMSDDGKEHLGLLSVWSAFGGSESDGIKLVVKKGEMDSYLEALDEAIEDWDELRGVVDFGAEASEESAPKEAVFASQGKARSPR